MHVALTQAGRQLLDDALSDHLATQERLLSGLPRAVREALAECLRTLLQSLCDTAPELPRAASTKPRAPGETSAH